MPRMKRMWRTELVSLPVMWACYNPFTFEPNSSTHTGPWARLVRLGTVMADGREVQTLLTPEQARVLARRLTQQADAIDRMNAEHGNGLAPDAGEVTGA